MASRRQLELLRSRHQLFRAMPYFVMRVARHARGTATLVGRSPRFLMLITESVAATAKAMPARAFTTVDGLRTKLKSPDVLVAAGALLGL